MSSISAQHLKLGVLAAQAHSPTHPHPPCWGEEEGGRTPQGRHPPVSLSLHSAMHACSVVAALPACVCSTSTSASTPPAASTRASPSSVQQVREGREDRRVGAVGGGDVRERAVCGCLLFVSRKHENLRKIQYFR